MLPPSAADALDAALALLSSRRRALRVGAANSLCTRERLAGLQSLADVVRRRRVAGDAVECGVYRGGSAVVIGERLLSAHARRLWLFDVFSGMPAPGQEDPPEAWKEVGTLASSEERVRATVQAAGLPQEAVEVVVGRYEDTLPALRVPKIAFLHIDCDWYEPVRLCLETFYGAVSPGGAIVLDDYGHWSGCRRAVDEFLAEHRIACRLDPIDYTSHYFFKTADRSTERPRGRPAS